jgi:hypothetical protein
MTRKPRVYFAYPACPKAEGWGVGNYPRIFWPRRGFRGSGDYTTWHFHRPIYINWQGGKTGAGPHEEVSPSGVVNPQGKMTPAQIEQAKLEGKFR